MNGASPRCYANAEERAALISSAMANCRRWQRGSVVARWLPGKRSEWHAAVSGEDMRSCRWYRVRMAGYGVVAYRAAGRAGVTTQSRKLPTYFFSFGPSQHSLRLLLETSLGKTLAAVGPTRAGLVLLRFSKPKHQSTTNPGSAPGPG